MDTGTIARSGSAGNASWRIRYSRSAPAQIAMTTSFTVPPVASFSALMLLSATVRMANRRCGPIRLFQGVGGAGVTGSTTRLSWLDTRSDSSDLPAAEAIASRDLSITPLTLSSPARPATLRAKRSCSRAAFTGLVAKAEAVCFSNAPLLGISSAAHATGCTDHFVSALSSVMSFNNMTPAAPSTVA